MQAKPAKHMNHSPTCQVERWKSWNQICAAAPRLCLEAESRAALSSRRLRHTEIPHHTILYLFDVGEAPEGQNMENLLITGACIQYTRWCCMQGGGVWQEARHGSLIVCGEKCRQGRSSPLSLPILWFHIVSIRCKEEYLFFSDQCDQNCRLYLDRFEILYVCVWALLSKVR